MAPKELTKILINESDGVDTVYPDNLTKVVKSDGSYDYFRPVQENEPKDLLWRMKTAKALVDTYKIGQPGKDYIFASLPENYKLFEHVKGKKDAKERTDTYLFGHPTGKRFRSPAEFQVHIFHLASLSPANAGEIANQNAICACWICAGAKPGPGAASGATPNRKGRASENDVNTARREIAAEERLGEQETVGWIARKGEIVWAWVADEDWDEDEDSPKDGSGGQWAAGVVRTRPIVNTPIKKVVKTGGTFADIDMDDTPTWQQSATVDEQTYTIQLCSNSKGQVLERVPQHLIRPWLARPEYIDPPPSYSGRREHPSIPHARSVVSAFSLFDRSNKGEYASEHEGEVLTAFGGIFLGAEKIFVGEPVRIPNPPDDPSAEDVMVVQNIYTSTTKSSSKPGKTTTVTLFNGQVYTTSPRATLVTAQQFTELPFRMRRSDSSGETIKWHIRNSPNERGEISLKLILGRWYEPVAVNEWMRHSSESQMRGKFVDRWVGDRMDALKDTGVNELELKSGIDGRKPEKATLAATIDSNVEGPPPPVDADGGDGDPMDVDAPENRMETPERSTGFKSVNHSSGVPGSGGKNRMAMAVQDDEDDEESEDMGIAALGKSPTKRMVYR